MGNKENTVVNNTHLIGKHIRRGKPDGEIYSATTQCRRSDKEHKKITGIEPT